MTKRIFRSMFFVAMVVLLAVLGLILGTLYRYFTQVQFNQLRVEAALASHAVANEGLGYFDKLDNTMDCRITWISADGTVLYDNRSDSGVMENHLERQEVLQAMAQGYGQSVRYSDTLLERYIYAAERLPDGSVLRLSTSQSSVLKLLMGLSGGLLLAVLAAVVLSLYLSGRLAQHIVRPLNALDLDHPREQGGYEELAPLLRRLDYQQTQLKGKETELRQRQKEFHTVTQALSEGLVLLSADGTVLSINPAAARLLGVTPNCLGADFSVVNQNGEIDTLVTRAAAGRKAEAVVSLQEGMFLASVSPVLTGGTLSGVVVLLFDVTRKHQSELLRREFTANVSHELKTPLHAISGYAELLRSGLVSREDTALFVEKIYAESRRMARLVENTLRLAHLDEGAEGLQWGPVDVFQAARQAVEELSAAAELAKVQLNLTGSAASLEAIPQLVSAIVFNLADNAIKYNRPGGRVDITVEQQGPAVALTVADTGIGIPADQQERIFERFYRVDKSRSKETGGTGLGLSLVKHAAQILGGEVRLESRPGAGTTVCVRLPRERMR